jgi:hypothetical protein
MENVFGRWKKLFGICHEVSRREIKLLSTIRRVTVAITNWHIGCHPLWQLNEKRIDESSSDRPGEMKKLDESSDDRNSITSSRIHSASTWWNEVADS